MSSDTIKKCNRSISQKYFTIVVYNTVQILMKIMTSIMHMLPKKILDSVSAIMVQKWRATAGKDHPIIAMNSTNMELILCLRE